MILKKGDQVEWCGEPAPVRCVGTVIDYIEIGCGFDQVEVLWDLQPSRKRTELRMNIRLVSILDKIVEALDA